MKKIYKTPVAECIALATNPVMNNLSLQGGTNPTSGRGSSINQKGDEYRGDWSGIWDNM